MRRLRCLRSCSSLSRRSRRRHRFVSFVFCSTNSPLEIREAGPPFFRPPFLCHSPTGSVPRPSSLLRRPSFVVVLQLQQTISRLTDECWDKCVSSPSTYFSGKENACLDNCAKRFMDTTQFVIKYYNSKNSRSGGFDEFS